MNFPSEHKSITRAASNNSCSPDVPLIGSSNKRRDPLGYAFAEQLENIGDWYKEQAKEALQKIPKISGEKLKKVNSCIELLYDLYFAFSLEKLELFGKKIDEIKKEIQGEEKLHTLLTMYFDIQGVILTKRV